MTNFWLQLGFDEIDNKALVRIGDRWRVVPTWIAAEWMIPGMHSKIIQQWQGGLLTRIRKYPFEDQAIHNIDDAAEALLLYYSNPLRREYRDELSEVEQQCLRLERKYLKDYPHYAAKDRYQAIALQLSVIHKSRFGPAQVAALLQDATDALRERARLDRIKKLERLLSTLQDIAA